MILDPTSEGDKILDFLKELMVKLNDLQEKAFQYKSYQKSFKVILSVSEPSQQLDTTHTRIIALAWASLSYVPNQLNQDDKRERTWLLRLQGFTFKDLATCQ